MSIPDDYKDLESRLRRSKPQTEPLPPAFKRQMRHDLMEQMTMNDNRFSLGKLSMALGGLVILVGIPLLFWLSQMSVGTGSGPGAATDSTQLDPTRPTPTVSADVVVGEGEAPAVNEGEDRVWLVSADVAQGETVGRFAVINLTIGYELVTVEEAEIIVKLVDGLRGALTAEKMVSGTSGTAEIPLSLAELEDVSGESITLELNLLLRDPAVASGELLYLDFLEGWTVDLTAELPATTAEIIHISKPNIVETDGVVNESVYEVEITVAYSLSGIDSAVLVAGYEFVDANGGGGGYEVNAVSAGNGEIPLTLWITREFFNARGELIDGVNFFARINRYDEASAEWVNVYPGNVTLSDAERSLPYPYIRDSFVVHSTAWEEDATGQAVLNVMMGYSLESEETAEISIEVTGENGVMLASETAVIEAGQALLTIPIVLDETGLADVPNVMVSAVLKAGEVVIEDELPAVYQNQTTASGTDGQSEIWIVSTDVATRTTETGVAADITLVVGYDLSSEYSSGLIAFSNQYTASANGGGSGGGGGSQYQVAPGNGTARFVISFETSSWAAARDWLSGMEIYLKLFGHTAAGEQVLVSEFSKIGTD